MEDRQFLLSTGSIIIQMIKVIDIIKVLGAILYLYVILYNYFIGHDDEEIKQNKIVFIIPIFHAISLIYYFCMSSQIKMAIF